MQWGTPDPPVADQVLSPENLKFGIDRDWEVDGALLYLLTVFDRQASRILYSFFPES